MNSVRIKADSSNYRVQVIRWSWDMKKKKGIWEVEINVLEHDMSVWAGGNWWLGDSSEVTPVWHRRAPVQLPGLRHTPFNTTPLWICQRERGRRSANCYFKLSARICVMRCLLRPLRQRQAQWHVGGSRNLQRRKCEEEGARSCCAAEANDYFNPV